MNLFRVLAWQDEYSPDAVDEALALVDDDVLACKLKGCPSGRLFLKFVKGANLARRHRTKHVGTLTDNFGTLKKFLSDSSPAEVSKTSLAMATHRVWRKGAALQRIGRFPTQGISLTQCESSFGSRVSMLARRRERGRAI